jgi:hypothetical protein
MGHSSRALAGIASAAAIVLGLAILESACGLTTDLSTLKNGQCPSEEKACLVAGKEQCVSTSDPKTGCSAQSCLSCDVKVANAVTTCSAAGACTIAACNAGYIDCNQSDVDGCEIDIEVDTSNCGLCGTVCGPAPHAAPICLHEVCALQCAADYGDCDGKYSNGCEVSLLVDPKNCGRCGAPCDGGQTCTGGGCR